MGAHGMQEATTASVDVRPLEHRELDAADVVMKRAFGTFLALPDPEAFMGDASLIGPRWRLEAANVFAAVIDGRLVGSNVATRWGSVGIFGPLSVDPSLWDRGIAQRLLEPVLERFEEWGVRDAGLFTWAHSPKHLALYQRYGYWPRYLTAIMARPVTAGTAGGADTLAGLPAGQRDGVLAACRDLTGAVHDGLDVTAEAAAVVDHGYGDTVLLEDDGALAAFAVCHHGAGSEAGSGACLVKFAAARPGPGATDRLGRLLDACERFAADRGLGVLMAGANTARREAYRLLLDRGMKIEIQGVAMQRDDAPIYNRPGALVVDDWR